MASHEIPPSPSSKLEIIMTSLNLDASHLILPPEIHNFSKWVPSVLAVGGLIIAEQGCDLIAKANPQQPFSDEPPELPPLPVSPEQASFLLCDFLPLWKKLELVLMDLNHTRRQTFIEMDVLVRMIESSRTIGGLLTPHGWYVLRTWDCPDCLTTHPQTKHTILTGRTRKERLAVARDYLAADRLSYE